jgi:hypothetical protein
MNEFNEKDEIKFEDFQEDVKYNSLLTGNANEIICLPNDEGDLNPETYNFAKWVKKHRQDVSIQVAKAKGTTALKSSDFWLPLVFLASDVTLQIYLNIVSSYVYDMARGALKHDKGAVHLAAIYHDTASGKMKRFKYKGSVKGLETIKFDANKFLEG